MRIATLFTGAAAAALAVAAPAQDADQAGTEAPPEFGLSDLSGTVNQLSDSPSEEAAPEEQAREAEASEEEAGSEAARESGEAEAQAPQAEAVTAAVQASGESEVQAAPTASAQTSPPPPVDADQRAEMELAAARGRQLFAIARAGMLATQDMLSRVADPAAAGITGWVAEPEGNAMAVTFYGDGDSGPVAIYRSTILGGRAVSRETFLTGDRPPLSAVAERMARARAASETDEQRACTNQPFNVLAIPPEAADDPIHIYRISAPASRSRLPLGGHFRSTVGADGSVTESRGFSRGCLNVDVGEVPAGSQAGPIAVTHLLDPLPTEIHVFLSLFAGRPLVIAAGDPTRLFMVAGDAIREIRR
jgi:hypothetical protein